MNRSYVYWAAFIAALGGFLQSYANCVIAGALCFICKEFSLLPHQEGFVASIILLGALFGSTGCGYLADKLGRRLSILIAALIYTGSSLLILSAGSLTALLALRFATGVAAGMTSILAPLYLAEIAPPTTRGIFVTSYQFFITVGTLLAYVVNMTLLHTADWRLMLMLLAVPAGFQAVGLCFFPESPKWLARFGKKDDFKKTVAKLYGEKSSYPMLKDEPGKTGGWKDLLKPSYRFIILLGLALSFFQQGCGINAIIFFTPKIFKEAGFSSANTAMFATLLIGVINLFSTFSAFFLIDRIGRRKLLLISQLGVVLSLFIIITGFATEIRWIDFISVIALMAYVASYSLGIGPVPWVLISEMYPLSIRAKAMAVMTCFSSFSTYTVVQTFPSLVSWMGITLTFAVYFLLALTAFLIFYRWIPETKGKSLEELEKLST